MLVFGDWTERMLVLASISNFLLFFHRDIFHRLRIGRRHMEFQASLFGGRSRPYFHRCTVCGITDQSDPHAQFRYCRKCEGSHAYCMEHLLNHEHIKKGG